MFLNNTIFLFDQPWLPDVVTLPIADLVMSLIVCCCNKSLVKILVTSSLWKFKLAIVSVFCTVTAILPLTLEKYLSAACLVK